MEQDRIELESKLTFVERTLDALQGVLRDQERTIRALEKRIARLEKRAELESGRNVGPHDAPPPHY